jgi:3-phosphoshikimate 1-carboxyvinyltransferase
MSSYTITSAKRVRGETAVPGDKSISHRAAMIAAIAEGSSELIHYSPSEDCRHTLACLRALGVRMEPAGDRLLLEGVGRQGLRPPEVVLDAGNSGTTMRLLSGILAGQPFESQITGDESLQRRPMSRIIQPLRLMGANITARDNNYAPLHIRGGRLRAITYDLPVASAQVKSCLLLAGLFAEGTTRITEPAPTRDHTEIMLTEFGADAVVNERTVSVSGQSRLHGRSYRIPGDISSAAFFVAAALMLPDSEVVVRDVGVNPTRTGFVEVLRRLGASIEYQNARRQHGEPVADLIARSSQLKNGSGWVIGGDLIPGLIDELPLLAVVATRIDGGLEICDARELRVKESDRIRATVENLRQMGAQVEEREDGMTVPGPQRLRGAPVDSFGDHRLAMAFAIAGLMAEGETDIGNREAVAVSFPDFFAGLEDLVD